MKKMIRILLILVLLGVLVWAVLIGVVVWQEKHVGDTTSYDAIIVLGAQVRPDYTPSVQLGWRLDTAAEAYKAHKCWVVTCGAQGSDEPAPEGDVMREYLIKAGVAPEDILVDNTSMNTRQNITNAARLLDGRAARVLIVTSDYHLPRAMALARDLGMDATGLGSPTLPEYWLKNHAREALSYVKYWAQKLMGVVEE